MDRATCTWENRKPFLSNETPIDVAAIDAPLVPRGCLDQRSCETLFSCGAFQRRCKPGMSHVRGTGQKLRAAGTQTAEQLGRSVSGKDLHKEFPRIYSNKNLVEAFPNAYLGVLLPESTYGRVGKISRGKKFDWLYEQCVSADLFPQILDTVKVSRRRHFLDNLRTNRNHDERAALVCLLTAAGVAAGKYTAFGNAEAGYIFLPPWEHWQGWAKEALACGQARCGDTDMWIDGQRFSCFGAFGK